jgi:FKBP-type peptidyl-prolyl cis-trans isomerase SlpA
MSPQTPAIRPGSRIELHLQIRLADGTEVLSSFAEVPMELTIGDGTLATDLEDLLIGLPSGADERFFADGSELYGPRDELEIQWLPRSDFPSDIELDRGQILAFEAPDGQEAAGLLLEMDAERIQVDFNHPLAGRAVLIRAHILSVNNPE